MSKYIKGTDKNQLNMIPMALDEMISEDNPVRVIDALVNSLDMKSLEFKYDNPKKYGRKSNNAWGRTGVTPVVPGDVPFRTTMVEIYSFIKTLISKISKCFQSFKYNSHKFVFEV